MSQKFLENKATMGFLGKLENGLFIPKQLEAKLSKVVDVAKQHHTPNKPIKISAASMETTQPLPLFLTKVPAGFPSPADDHRDGNLDMNEYLVKNPAATFYVRATGHSMIGAGIHPNDILVVDRSITPQHGHVIIAVLAGELTVKRLILNGERVILKPENEDYDVIEVTEQADFSVWGVVTNVVHSLVTS